MPLLEIKNLRKVYGGENSINSTHALNDIDFRIESSEFIGVMGPSGSGKTTLLNILSGIDKPTSGKVIISNRDIIELNNDELALFRRKKFGFVFQEFNLLDSLTLKENIILPMILDKQDSSAIETKFEEVVSLFNIKDICNKYPYQVSGGQQQRAAISRSLMNDPYIIFADEPTGNLDSKSSRSVMDCFRKMNEEKKCTIMMVTHDTFAASFCKKIVFIKDGKITLEIIRKGSQKQFFNEILDYLAVLGGDENDLP